METAKNISDGTSGVREAYFCVGDQMTLVLAWHEGSLTSYAHAKR